MADTKERPANPFGFKRITEYSDGELAHAVEIAVAHCKTVEVDFYAVLRGIDAYMEKRRRKDATQPGSNTPYEKV